MEPGSPALLWEFPWTDNSARMAFADWLLLLLLLTPEEEHGRVPFDWASLESGPELPRVPVAQASPPRV
jgi:hypothetical protein